MSDAAADTIPCDRCAAPSTCFCGHFKACHARRCDAHRDNADACSTRGHDWVRWDELDAALADTETT